MKVCRGLKRYAGRLQKYARGGVCEGVQGSGCKGMQEGVVKICKGWVCEGMQGV